VLILVNGAYGARMARICQVMGRAHATLETPEDVPPAAATVDVALAGDPAITRVAIVHCETTSGILSPVRNVAEVVTARGRRLRSTTHSSDSPPRAAWPAGARATLATVASWWMGSGRWASRRCCPIISRRPSS